MLKETSCNLCGSDQYSIVYKTYDGDISSIKISSYTITDNERGMPLRLVKCTACGLVYANPRPPLSSLIDNYSNMIDPLYMEEERGRRLSADIIINRLHKFKKSGKLLDIGCATGILLDQAKIKGWDVYGVDLSKWALNHAREKYGIKNLFQGALKNADYPPNHFDAIVMKDSIEHLTDPKGMLIEIRRILKPDGILCVNTPDMGSHISRMLKAKWWGVKQSHLYYFDKKSLFAMLETAGFTPIKTTTHARVFSLRYWFLRIKDYSPGLYKLFSFFFNKNFLNNGLLKIDLGDQIEVYARKSRKLQYLDELEAPAQKPENKDMRTIVVLPAYNAEQTLKRTIADIPRDAVNSIILVDDASRDGTVRLAGELGLKVFVHEKNKGYGANQKTCYTKALEDGADIVVMVHPDYQYDPKVIPELIKPIKEGKADAVFGSRMMKGGALVGGMPIWKHNANIMLTAVENVIFGTYLTEYHSGFRAYSAKLLRTVKFNADSDGFIFDTEIIAQILLHGYKIDEVPIRTRYFDEASTIKVGPSILYGLGILKTLLKYVLHTNTFIKFKQFE
jgi:ubiquinone/menaquinone biosynthesis C-methylase UbiE